MSAAERAKDVYGRSRSVSEQGMMSTSPKKDKDTIGKSGGSMSKRRGLAALFGISRKDRDSPDSGSASSPDVSPAVSPSPSGRKESRDERDDDREINLLERKKERDKQRRSTLERKTKAEKGGAVSDSLDSDQKKKFVRLRAGSAESGTLHVNPLLELQQQEENASQKGTWEPPSSWRVITERSEEGSPVKSAGVARTTPLPGLAEEESEEAVHKGPWVAPASWLEPVASSHVRIYKRDGTFTSVTTTPDITAAGLIQLLARKFHVRAEQYSLYLSMGGAERQLGPNELPIQIMRDLLMQIGYAEEDGMDDQGRKDHAYYFTFIFSDQQPPRVDVTPMLKADARKVTLIGKNLQYIPPMLYKRAPGIEELVLSRNIHLDIPNDFAQLCTSLQYLRITHNEYVDLPAGVGALVSLRRLSISENRLRGSLPRNICQLVNLVELDARCNQLAALPDEFPSLVNLTILNLSNNAFDTFPRPLCLLPNVRVLDISYNRLSGLPPEIKELKKMVILRAVGNRIATLPSTLPQLQLNELDIRSNALTDLSSLDGCTTLKKLYCDANNISVLVLPQSLSAVRELTATRNGMTRFDLEASSSQLLRLILSHNKLTQLPTALTALGLLEELSLDDNHLISLPSGIKQLKKLRDMSIASNELAELPAEIGELSMLTQLDLHGNNLRRLPTEIWKLKSLMLLNLSSNLLERFPEADKKIGRALATSLLELMLADNRLSSLELFSAIAHMTHLRHLNIAYNDLDELPPSIALFEQLETLNISGNLLTSLPDEVGLLKQLSRLYANGNKLVSVTTELAKCKLLEVADFSHNNLKYSLNSPHDWNWNLNKELHHLNLSGNARLLSAQTGDDAVVLDKLRVLNLNDLNTAVSLPDRVEQRAICRRVAAEGGGGLSFGVGDALGQDGSYDTYDVAMTDFQGDKSSALYALFEGRNGATTSSYCQSWVPYKLVTELGAMKNPASALRRTFISVNKDHGLALHKDSRNSLYPNDEVSSTSTGAAGLVALVREGYLHVASAGNCIAVASRSGKAVTLGTVQDPYNEEEVRRIRAAGGFIGPNRLLNGVLNVTRAFGHFDHFPVVNANPQITSIKLTDEDEFIVLGSSALWNVLTPQMAVDIARTERKSPPRAAQKIRDFALAYGATGSLTVMVASSTTTSAAATRRVTKARSSRQDVTDSTLARLDAEVEPPTGKLALVFTDIKNSTLLWETNPVAMRAAIKVHNNIMRRNLRNFGGYEVKTEGDAFMVAFQDPVEAARMCLTVQQQLIEADWPQETLDSPDGRETRGENGQLLFRGLSVRMGIHVGEPVCEKDPVTGRMDYFGPVVNRAARVSAAADGGQVVISEDAWKEIKLSSNASLLDSLEMAVIDMGLYKLKGLEGSEHLMLLLPGNLAARRAYYHNIQENGSRVLEESDKAVPAGPKDTSTLPVSLETLTQLDQIARRLEVLAQPSQPTSPTVLDMLSTPPTATEVAKALELATARIEAAVGSMWFQKMGGFAHRINQLLSTGSGQTPHFGRLEDPLAMMRALEFALSKVSGGAL